MYSNFSEGRGRLYTRYNLSNSLKNTQQPNVHVNVQPKSRNRGEIFYYFGLDRSIISWEGVQVFSFADLSSLATSQLNKFIKHRSIQCPVTLISGPVIIYPRWGGVGGGGLKTLAGFRGGTTQICLKDEDVGGGGSRKSSKVTRGDHFSEAAFKGGIG